MQWEKAGKTGNEAREEQSWLCVYIPPLSFELVLSRPAEQLSPCSCSLPSALPLTPGAQDYSREWTIHISFCQGTDSQCASKCTCYLASNLFLPFQLFAAYSTSPYCRQRKAGRKTWVPVFLYLLSHSFIFLLFPLQILQLLQSESTTNSANHHVLASPQLGQ